MQYATELFLQCFVAVGWVTGQEGHPAVWPVKISHQQSPNVLRWET